MHVCFGFCNLFNPLIVNMQMEFSLDCLFYGFTESESSAAPPPLFEHYAVVDRWDVVPLSVH